MPRCSPTTSLGVSVHLCRVFDILTQGTKPNMGRILCPSKVSQWKRVEIWTGLNRAKLYVWAEVKLKCFDTLLLQVVYFDRDRIN